MADPAYADWLQRGRTHQWEGRPVDAMLCFQRAAAIAPDGVDARYLLGEVQWQVGAIAASVAAWRDAARVAPSTSPRTSRWPKRTSRWESPDLLATLRSGRRRWRRTTRRPCCCERWPPSPAITIATRSKVWARTLPPVRAGSPRPRSVAHSRTRCAHNRTRRARSICWRPSCRTWARSRSRCSRRWRTARLPLPRRNR